MSSARKIEVPNFLIENNEASAAWLNTLAQNLVGLVDAKILSTLTSERVAAEILVLFADSELPLDEFNTKLITILADLDTLSKKDPKEASIQAYQLWTLLAPFLQDNGELHRNITTPPYTLPTQPRRYITLPEFQEISFDITELLFSHAEEPEEIVRPPVEVVSSYERTHEELNAVADTILQLGNNLAKYLRKLAARTADKAEQQSLNEFSLQIIDEAHTLGMNNARLLQAVKVKTNRALQVRETSRSLPSEKRKTTLKAAGENLKITIDLADRLRTQAGLTLGQLNEITLKYLGNGRVTETAILIDIIEMQIEAGDGFLATRGTKDALPIATDAVEIVGFLKEAAEREFEGINPEEYIQRILAAESNLLYIHLLRSINQLKYTLIPDLHQFTVGLRDNIATRLKEQVAFAQKTDQFNEFIGIELYIRAAHTVALCILLRKQGFTLSPQLRETQYQLLQTVQTSFEALNTNLLFDNSKTENPFMLLNPQDMPLLIEELLGRAEELLGDEADTDDREGIVRARKFLEQWEVIPMGED